MDHFFHRLRKHLQKITKLPRKKKILLAIWTILSILILIAVFTTLYYATTLASKDRIMNRNNTGLTLLDRNGKVYYQFYNAHSSNQVPLSQIAPIAQQALIASEDKNFYKENGFSFTGILRAVSFAGGRGGGSTISQQLVKGALLTQNRSLLRKYQELILSVELNQKYSKNEILEMYMNSVYFGEGAFGIQDAAKTYFGKDAKDLDNAQAAMLIGIIPAPSAYSPISGNATYAKQRQTYVLNQMEANGFLNKDQQQAALAEPLTYAPPAEQQQLQAPHFALMVRDQLVKQYGEEKIARSGDKVTTTIDLDTQKKAEDAVKAQVSKLSRSKVSNGAAVVEDPRTGEIRAMVGSVDWYNTDFGKVNMATASRQPGSSFKPIMYATGLQQKDFSAATIFKDQATDFNGYKPHNYDNSYHGDVTMRKALSNSLNIPAIEAIQKAGVGNTIDTAKKMGLTTLTDSASHYGLPLALGTAQAKLTEMTNAYATFADQGVRPDLQTIQKIADKTGKVVFKEKQKTTPAVDSEAAYVISSVLSDNTARASEFGSSLTVANNRPVAVKTGTTEDYRDAWTIGYTPSLAVGVWIGNNDNSQMSAVAGSSGAAPIWRQIMQELLSGTSVEQFPKPGGIVSADICRSSGALADQTNNSTMTEYFLPDTLPTAHCNQKPAEQQPQPEQPVQPTTPTDNSDDQNQDEETKTPTYSAQVQSYNAVDSSTLRVTVTVNNTGTGSGTPVCTIVASGNNAGQAYNGTATMQRSQDLTAGSAWTFSKDITIANQGAQYITNVTASCA